MVSESSPDLTLGKDKSPLFICATHLPFLFPSGVGLSILLHRHYSPFPQLSAFICNCTTCSSLSFPNLSALHPLLPPLILPLILLFIVIYSSALTSSCLSLCAHLILSIHLFACPARSFPYSGHAGAHVPSLSLPALPVTDLSGAGSVRAGLLHVLLVRGNAQGGQASLPVACQDEELWAEQQ